MLLTLEIFALLTMIVLMFVLIWGFILLSQVFGQLRYKNYLMEKLIEVLYNKKIKGCTDTDKEA